MATNPLIAQGTLNRLRGSFVVANLPKLNVTAPYLGKEGIRLSLDGEASAQLPTMTGTVQSPEPYMMATATLHILKTNGLASQYKAQMEDNSVIGNVMVTPDTTALPNFSLLNCAIEGVRELSFAGEDAVFAVTVRGYYVVNNSLWDLT